MKHITNHPLYGQIVYEESFWTGKKTISIGGVVLQKFMKNTFCWGNGEDVKHAILSGNTLLGVTLTICGEQVCVWPKPVWYDWVLSFLPLVLIMIWGNSAALCRIIPVIGGAIGGGICGGAAVTAMYLTRGKNIGIKLLVTLCTAIITFGICAALGYALLAMVSANP